MTKKEVKGKFDYWMLYFLNEAIDSIDRGYHPVMAKESMASARAVMQAASSLGIIGRKEFENINHCLCFTSLMEYNG